jgi:hypothetical protein
VANTWKWQKILSDSSYLVDFHVTLPLDTIRYTDFLFVADYGLNLPEISKLNNTLYSDTLVVKHYLIEETDYKLLKLLHEQTGGTQWNTKWKTSTNLLIAGNWPGVGFEKGRVVSIDLNHNNLRGKIPHGIFQLPQLRSLSLNNNRLTGQLEVLADSLKRNNIRCDSLSQVNLGFNLLSGEVSAFANRFPNLTGLNLESNQFNRIDSLLSKKITTLNLQNQVFSHSEIPLSMNPALSIPSLFRYRHDTQELNRTDLYFNLYKNGNYLGWINFRDARFALRLNAEWSYASRDSFDLIQSNSYLYGCKTKLRLNFKPGDANIDERTDILDVQQTLNRVLVENPYPFNRVAANTFADNQITVQDIVSTVNLLLQSGVVVDSTQLAGSTPKSGNVLFIADGKIMMDVQEPVSALDLSLTNISDQQIDVLLNSDDFQSLARNTAEGVRVIVFSGTGKEIPAGLTPLANLRAPTAEVVGATLANKQANSVSVQITREPTFQRDLTTSDYSVYLGKHNIILQLKENVGQLTAELINLQGVLIDRREMNQLTVGSHTIDYTDNLSTGAYLLKLTFRNGDSVQTRNFKWIVSK